MSWISSKKARKGQTTMSGYLFEGGWAGCKNTWTGICKGTHRASRAMRYGRELISILQDIIPSSFHVGRLKQNTRPSVARTSEQSCRASQTEPFIYKRHLQTYRHHFCHRHSCTKSLLRTEMSRQFTPANVHNVFNIRRDQVAPLPSVQDRHARTQDSRQPPRLWTFQSRACLHHF